MGKYGGKRKDGQRYCRACRRDLPEKHFYLRSDGKREQRCKTCKSHAVHFSLHPIIDDFLTGKIFKPAHQRPCILGGVRDF